MKNSFLVRFTSVLMSISIFCSVLAPVALAEISPPSLQVNLHVYSVKPYEVLDPSYPAHKGSMYLDFSSFGYSGDVDVSFSVYEVKSDGTRGGLVYTKTRESLPQYGSYNTGDNVFAYELWNMSRSSTGEARRIDPLLVKGKTYEFEFFLDNTNKIQETDETDNKISYKYTIPSLIEIPQKPVLKPDFAFQSATVRTEDLAGKAGVISGKVVYVDLSVSKTDTTTDPGVAIITTLNDSNFFYMDSVGISTGTSWKYSYPLYLKANLSTGEVVRNPFNFTEGTTGTVAFSVDPSNVVAESNETNNAKSATYSIPVIPTVAPEVAVKSLKVRTQKITKSDFSGVIGEGVKVIVDAEVTTNLENGSNPDAQLNINNATEGTFPLSNNSFYSNKTWKYSREVYLKVNTSTGEVSRNFYGLKEGVSVPVTFGWADNKTPDTNRNNNSLTTSYTLQPSVTNVCPQVVGMPNPNSKPGCVWTKTSETTLFPGCTVPKYEWVCSAKIDGKCGTAARTYSANETAYSGSFCAAGKQIVSTQIGSNGTPFPSTGGSITWICAGENQGKSVECSASRSSQTEKPLDLSVQSFTVGSQDFNDSYVGKIVRANVVVATNKDESSYPEITFTVNKTVGSPIPLNNTTYNSQSKTWSYSYEIYQKVKTSTMEVYRNPLDFKEGKNNISVTVRSTKISEVENNNNTASTTYTLPIITTTPPAGYEAEVIDTTTPTYNPFSDVSANTLAGKAAIEMYSKGIVGGYSDGTFKGNRLVNRAEITKFLLLARYGISTVTDIRNNGAFSDVGEGEWYTKFVMTALSKGIITGYSDGTFAPGKTVNTVEFLALFAKTFSLQENLTYSYADVNSGAWYAKYAGIAAKYNLFPNRNAGYLMPEQGLTREEVVVALYQYFHNK